MSGSDARIRRTKRCSSAVNPLVKAVAAESSISSPLVTRRTQLRRQRTPLSSTIPPSSSDEASILDAASRDRLECWRLCSATNEKLCIPQVPASCSLPKTRSRIGRSSRQKLGCLLHEDRRNMLVLWALLVATIAVSLSHDAGGVCAFGYIPSSRLETTTSRAISQDARYTCSMWARSFGTYRYSSCKGSTVLRRVFPKGDDNSMDSDESSPEKKKDKPKRKSRFSKEDDHNSASTPDISATLPSNTAGNRHLQQRNDTAIDALHPINGHDDGVNGNGLLSNGRSNAAANSHRVPSPTELQLLQRVMQLEQLVSAQQVQLRRMTEQMQEMSQSTTAFAEVIALFREAGLQQKLQGSSTTATSPLNATQAKNGGSSSSLLTKVVTKESTSLDDAARSMFGTAPASVMDAADAAGASILAGVLAGKQRMLVDVRDAELSFAPQSSLETLVQFIELAILPVAAGLEGLRSRRNRLKIVFPTVSQLLLYRRHMALAAPEVVALSTLGFDPVERQDNLVVILVPSPEDEEGLEAMNALLNDGNSITQPVVVLNHHMVPVTGPAADFDVAYHLRLLSVQYMTDDPTAAMPSTEYENGPEKMFADLDAATTMVASEPIRSNATQSQQLLNDDEPIDTFLALDVLLEDAGLTNVASSVVDNVTLFDDDDKEDVEPTCEGGGDDVVDAATKPSTTNPVDKMDDLEDRDAALEAALKHAQEVGVHHGVTRAMVIRAYPQPWHVFVDTSPDTDADYEVAATFADEPDIDQVNTAIMECLEGSELEDELVAQQMQQALELGQLDRISEMLSSMGLDDLDIDEDEEDDDDEDPYKDMFGEDTE